MLKIGTSSLIRPKHKSLNLSSIAKLCECIKDLRDEGMSTSVATLCVLSAVLGLCATAQFATCLNSKILVLLA